MGRLPQGAFQGFIGKTGGLVGKRWKGGYIVSAYQPKVANPKSTNQLIQRTLFKESLAIVQSFLHGTMAETISTGWNGMTAWASNIGITLRVNRALYLSENGLSTATLLNSIPGGSMCTGLADFGNTIFDELEIVQGGATANFDLGVITLTPGIKHFGSDVPLGGLRCIAQTTNVNGVNYTDVDMGLTPQVVNQDLEKVYGWCDTPEECGNWNFVYRCATSTFMTSGISFLSKYKGAGVHEAYVNIGYYIPNGLVFTSRVFYKQLTVV